MPNLENLPLQKGAAIVIGGVSAQRVAKRLAHYARQQKPKLRVVIGTPERMPDPKALTLFVPSYNREINRYLDRDGISGVVNALDANRFYFISAMTGETSQHILPPLPKSINDLIDKLYA